jgi:hypothetical protein
VYRQWEVNDDLDHDGNFQGRHIKLDEKLTFGAYLDNKEIYRDFVKANLPDQKKDEAQLEK